LTSDEVAEMERKTKAGQDMSSIMAEMDKENKGTPSSKRKAAGGPNSSSKKAKSGGPVKQPSTSPEEEEDDDPSD